MALPLHVLVIFVALPSSIIILCLISLTINAITSNSSPKVGPPSGEPDPETGNDAGSAERMPISPSDDERTASATEQPAVPHQQEAVEANDTPCPEAMVPGESAAAPNRTAGAKLQPLPGSPATLDALNVTPGSPSPLPRPGALPPLPSGS
jgi:hypothetical protein